MFEDFLANAASSMGTTQTNAGIVLSLLTTICVIVVVSIATKGKRFEIMGLIVSFFCTVMFTAMAWYPIWTGAIMALMIALLSGWYFSKMGGGAGS